ncbi:ferric reductase-like transmembrane domain-containing protein [Tateyamaria sp.]|uniref:ferric reductase-like transmembrane domain-containing protein n=1 Tax=Tateyamaria sp. TaxID=1929288 RepID=UPI0032A0E8F7
MKFITTILRATLTSTVLLYVALLWPGREAFDGLWNPDSYYPALMYDSGKWSVRLLIVTLSVTPVLLLINRLGRGQAIGRWLLRARRHAGLSCAIFAGLHLWYYVIELGTLGDVLFELRHLEIAVGWISFVIFAVLAATSNAWSVRRLGRNWKRLHVLIYPAGVLALWHWYLFDWYVGRVLFWCAVFAAPLLIRPLLRRLSRLTRRNPSPS